MKTNSLRLLALTIITGSIAATALAQTTATSDPVGYITIGINAGDGTNPALSFRGLGLTQTNLAAGAAESSTVNTIVDNEATWTDSQFNGASGLHYVEITSGAYAGTTYDIATTTDATNTIQTVQNFPAVLAAGTTFKVRKHWTIAGVFGPANEAGLQGGTATTADQILVYNGSGYDTYYYKTSGLGGTGWRKTGDNTTSRADTAIYPDDGMIVKRTPASNVNVTLLGAVKKGQTSFPIFTGLNFTPNPYATDMTLGGSGVYTGDPGTGLAGGTSTTADQILIYNGTGYDTYYYKTSGLGGTGWRKTGDNITDQSGVAIAVSSSVILNRSGASFNWVMPQHPASL